MCSKKTPDIIEKLSSNFKAIFWQIWAKIRHTQFTWLIHVWVVSDCLVQHSGTIGEACASGRSEHSQRHHKWSLYVVVPPLLQKFVTVLKEKKIWSFFSCGCLGQHFLTRLPILWLCENCPTESWCLHVIKSQNGWKKTELRRASFRWF